MLGMIIFKGVASLGIIGSGVCIGYIKGHELEKNVKDTQELQRILLVLENEISYRRSSLSVAFKNISYKTQNREFKRLFEEVIEKVINDHVSPYEAIVEVCDGSCAPPNINTKLLKELEDLFKNIGNSDVTGEKSNIEVIKHGLIQLEKEFIEYRDKYKKIYNAGGGLLGSAITLLFL